MLERVAAAATIGTAGSVPHLALRGIRKRYGETVAVDDVSLDLERGEFVALLGDSGCGKTTLLRIAAGFTRPDAGTVARGGEDLTHLTAAGRRMGFVFQSYALFPTRTVRDNIGFALEVARAPRRAIDAKVAELAALTDIERLIDRFPHELSGGQQQRVALARALAAEPDILLLDEPMSALDARIRARLRTELRALIDRLGVTTLYVTHDQEEALALADRVAVMRQGRIEQLGPPAEIYHAPQSRFVAEFVGVANLIEATAVPGGLSALGRVWSCHAGAAAGRDGRVTVLVRPERIALAADGLPGRVRTVSFRGAFARLEVETEAGAVLIADISSRAGSRGLPRPGDDVGLGFAAEDLHPIPEARP